MEEGKANREGGKQDASNIHYDLYTCNSIIKCECKTESKYTPTVIQPLEGVEIIWSPISIF